MPDLDATPRPSPEPPTCRQVLDLLAEEGYRPHLRPGEGTWSVIEFKREGRLHLVRISHGDPDFLQLCLGFLFDEPVPDAAEILRAGHDAQAAAKVVKLYVDPELRWYEWQAELFLCGQPLTALHLERCLAALRRAAADFDERLRVDAPRARA